MTDQVGVEWQDSMSRSAQVLTMIAAIAIDRLGGEIRIEQAEWSELNARYGGQAAVVFDDKGDGSAIIASIETVEGVAQWIDGRKAN